MAVVSISPISETQATESGVLTCTRVYQVRLTPAPNNQALAARNAYLGYVSAPAGMWLDTIASTQINRSQEWFEISAKYKVPNLSVATQVPTSRPSMASVSYEEFSEDYFTDCSPTPKSVVNAAGDRFDSFPQRRNAHMILQVSKNLASVDLMALDAFKFTTNSDVLTIKGMGFAANTLLFLPPTLEERVEQCEGVLYDYLSITYRLAADTALHQHIVANRGWNQRVGGSVTGSGTSAHATGGTIHPILTDDGSTRATPYPLNADGSVMGDSSATPINLTFIPYPSASWGIDFT